MKLDFYFGGRDWGSLGGFFLSETLKFNLDFNLLLFSFFPPIPLQQALRRKRINCKILPKYEVFCNTTINADCFICEILPFPSYLSCMCFFAISLPSCGPDIHVSSR